MKQEQRIYVAVAALVEVPVNAYLHDNVWIPKYDGKIKLVIQPIGRQVAQVAHAVSKLRFERGEERYACRSTAKYCDNQGKGGFMGHTCDKIEFQPITTIVLQARDSAELGHVYLLAQRRKLNPVLFSDENQQVYGPFNPPTAVAMFASRNQIKNIMDYLPLWGADQK